MPTRKPKRERKATVPMPAQKAEPPNLAEMLAEDNLRLAGPGEKGRTIKVYGDHRNISVVDLDAHAIYKAPIVPDRTLGGHAPPVTAAQAEQFLDTLTMFPSPERIEWNEPKAPRPTEEDYQRSLHRPYRLSNGFSVDAGLTIDETLENVVALLANGFVKPTELAPLLDEARRLWAADHLAQDVEQMNALLAARREECSAELAPLLAAEREELDRLKARYLETVETVKARHAPKLAAAEKPYADLVATVVAAINAEHGTDYDADTTLKSASLQMKPTKIKPKKT